MTLGKKLQINVWIGIILLLAWVIILFADFYLSSSIWWKIFAIVFIVFQAYTLSKSIDALYHYRYGEE